MRDMIKAYIHDFEIVIKHYHDRDIEGLRAELKGANSQLEGLSVSLNDSSKLGGIKELFKKVDRFETQLRLMMDRLNNLTATQAQEERNLKAIVIELETKIGNA